MDSVDLILVAKWKRQCMQMSHRFHPDLFPSWIWDFTCFGLNKIPEVYGVNMKSCFQILVVEWILIGACIMIEQWITTWTTWSETLLLLRLLKATQGGDWVSSAPIAISMWSTEVGWVQKFDKPPTISNSLWQVIWRIFLCQTSTIPMSHSMPSRS